MSFFPVSTGEKTLFDGDIDANIAYQRAVAHAGQLGWPVGTVMSAMAETAGEWPDVGHGRRAVFVMRWDGVTGMPGDQSTLGEQIQRRPVVGRQTVLIDAATGAFLGAGLDVDPDGERWVDRSGECDLAAVWVGRADMDARFLVKAGSSSRGLWHRVLQACTVLPPEDLPARLTELGAHFAKTLRLLDEHHGPVIGTEELTDVIAVLAHAVDTAERVTGRSLNNEKTALTQAAQRVLAG